MIITETLDNGMRIIAQRMEQVRSCAIGVWIGTGSVREDAAESGASHFIEHMLFKGTEKRSAQQIAAEMDGIGGNINAFTSKECTCFYAKVLDEHLEKAVDILSDIVRFSAFDPKEIEKEKGVVCEEILMVEDSPEDLAHDVLSSTYFAGDPLARPILGTKESVTSFTREGLLRYMGKHYMPGNIVIAVAGNLPPRKELIALLKRYFSSAGTGEGQEPAICNIPAGGRRFQPVQKDIEQIHICMGLPGVSLDAPEQYPLFVLSNALGGSMSSRLFQKIREQRGLAYSIYSYPSCYRSVGYFALYAGTGEQQAPEVVRLVLEELEEIRKNGITEEEFQRSRDQLKGSYLLSQEGTSSRMNALGKAQLLLNRLYSEEETIKRIEAVTMEDVRDITRKVLDLEQLSLVCVGRMGKQEKEIRKLCLGE